MGRPSLRSETVFASLRWLAALPLLGLLGACLPTLAPAIRPVEHHAGLTRDTGNAVCMDCHEGEAEVLAELQSMKPAAREHAMHQRMAGGGPSLVAQWMIDEPRSCATCHPPRGGAR